MEQYLDYLTNNGHIYYPYTRVEGIINSDGQPFSVWMSEVNTHNHDIRYASASHIHDNRYSLKTHTHEGFAASNHTHNYAGAESSGGPANSAKALAASFNINITGIGTGSASTNGSSDVTIDLTMNHNHDSDYLKLTGSSRTITITDTVPGGFGIIGDGIKPEVRLYDTTDKSTFGFMNYSGNVITMGINENTLFEVRQDGTYNKGEKLATEQFVTTALNGIGGSSDINVEILNEMYAAKAHVHNYDDISGAPIYLPNEHLLSITVPDGDDITTVDYDGTESKSLTISLESLGASPADHNHDSNYAPLVHTHTDFAAVDHTHPEYLKVQNGYIISITPSDASGFCIMSDGVRPSITLRDPNSETGFSGDINYTEDTFKFDISGDNNDAPAFEIDVNGSYVHNKRLATEEYVDNALSNITISGGSGEGSTDTNVLDLRYALKTHDHDTLYAALSHTHNQYSPTSHNHNDQYATIDHTHDEIYALKDHTHEGFAAASHLHSEYALSDHNHDSSYAASTHTHGIADITDFVIADGSISYNGNKLATEAFVLAEIAKLPTIEEEVSAGEAVEDSVVGESSPDEEATEEITAERVVDIPEGLVTGYVLTGLKEGEKFGTGATAEGFGNISSAYYTHAEGSNNIASGNMAHVEGNNNQATAIASHAEGKDNTASGYCSHVQGNDSTADGQCSHAGGYHCSATEYGAWAGGTNSNASGKNSFVFGNSGAARGNLSVAFGDAVSANKKGQFVIGRYNVASPTDIDNYGDLFMIGNGSGTTLTSNAFRVTNAGAVYAKAAYNASGADYAEYFEWEDGNTNAEDRRGYFVTMKGNKIKLATSNDSYILGIVSGKPSVVGNSDPDGWCNHFVRDEFGEFVMTENDEYIVNPDYDPDREYVSRSERKEWAAIGMMGVLVVRDDGSCQVDGYCGINDNGMATSSDTPGYRVIERINDNLIKIVFK